MAHYKDLNKELVNTVQSMRISLQQHREEIIDLRAKYMNKHEHFAFLSKKCKDLALMHCKQYLDFLDPDSSILSLLQDAQQGATVTPVQRRENIVENVNIRQSARLTINYRRSSSLTATRRSFNSTSPIRSPRPSVEEVVDDNDVELSAVMLAIAIPEEDEDEPTVEQGSDTSGFEV